MSKIIPVSITTTEQAVTLDATYQFAWLRNMGENDVLLSDHSDIVAGDDDVMTVKAGESGRITTSGRTVYIKAVSGTSTGEIHAQNFSDAPFKSKAKGGGQTITVEPLTVTDNGVYTAPTGKAYSPVSVDVQEQPWQPLEDGYSNFWFELTNDTLSPWLNFSAKNNNAVIDWGDGSGEQSLDTLTPTHTYSKAGQYVVKVKGVTGIGRINVAPVTDIGLMLKAIELNNEVTSIVIWCFSNCFALENVDIRYLDTLTTYCFAFCGMLQNIRLSPNLTILPTYTFTASYTLKTVNFPSGLTEMQDRAFYQSRGLRQITIPASVTSIGNSCFAQCGSLTEIHCQSQNPPTLGSDVFLTLPSNYIIYVPVGYGDTYKAASGWSTYADHILEKGQQPTRTMLARFKKSADDNESMVVDR